MAPLLKRGSELKDQLELVERAPWRHEKAPAQLQVPVGNRYDCPDSWSQEVAREGAAEMATRGAAQPNDQDDPLFRFTRREDGGSYFDYDSPALHTANDGPTYHSNPSLQDNHPSVPPMPPVQDESPPLHPSELIDALIEENDQRIEQLVGPYQSQVEF